jgi:hypothetical protein
VQSVTRHFKLVNLMTAVLLYPVDMRLLTSWRRYIWQPTVVLYAIQNEFKTRYLLHTRHKYLMLPFSCTFNLTAAVCVHCAAIKEQQSVTGCCLVYITFVLSTCTTMSTAGERGTVEHSFLCTPKNLSS